MRGHMKLEGRSPESFLYVAFECFDIMVKHASFWSDFSYSLIIQVPKNQLI